MAENKTIKQLADALGVSKTFVRRYMDEDFRLQHTATGANGVITIDPEGCKLISETIGNRAETPENRLSETTANSENKLYEMLQAELDAKNRQIEKLQAELAKEREHSREQFDKFAQLADQAQQLHAGDIRRLPVKTPSEGEYEAVEAFQGEDVLKPAQKPSAAQESPQEAREDLSRWQLLKMALFGR